ncbi:unnamed protein product [Leptidea sinapis]|uniref:Uncharacterized protein n=1 Tax=Leptidea sinapis TaxID=189913 RepID=A0A5E4Q4K9_9NEOP|nr:unnamed protein product [Leptidea sinapis]
MTDNLLIDNHMKLPNFNTFTVKVAWIHQGISLTCVYTTGEAGTGMFDIKYFVPI